MLGGGKNKLECKVVVFNTSEEIKRARKVINDAFKRDPDLRYGYQSNIAMLLHDQYGITEHDKRNAAANDILKLIFE